jgi:hypothetical protein
MWERLGDIVKGTLALNLKYTAKVLLVSTDYLKDFNGVLTAGVQSQPQAVNGPARRPALLLTGQLNETPSAAFALNNLSDKDINATLLVQGELSERNVRVSPSTVSLKPGENGVVRVLAEINNELETNRDYNGAVVVPGLSTQSVEFVVRRLPGEFIVEGGGKAVASKQRGAAPRKSR